MGATDRATSKIMPKPRRANVPGDTTGLFTQVGSVNRFLVGSTPAAFRR